MNSEQRARQIEVDCRIQAMLKDNRDEFEALIRPRLEALGWADLRTMAASLGIDLGVVLREDLIDKINDRLCWTFEILYGWEG